MFVVQNYCYNKCGVVMEELYPHLLGWYKKKNWCTRYINYNVIIQKHLRNVSDFHKLNETIF